MSSNREVSPLLEYLDQRWKEFVGAIPDPTWDKPSPRPQFHESQLDKLVEAAHEYARSDNSDPFAYARAVRRLKSGEWSISETLNDARKRIAAKDKVGVNIPFAA